MDSMRNSAAYLGIAPVKLLDICKQGQREQAAFDCVLRCNTKHILITSNIFFTQVSFSNSSFLDVGAQKVCCKGH